MVRVASFYRARDRDSNLALPCTSVHRPVGPSTGISLGLLPLGTRPRDKCLAGTLQTSPAEELGQRVGGVPLPLAGEETKSGENSLGFLKAHIDLSAEASVPAKRRSSIALGCLVAEKETEFKRFVQADMLELSR